MIKHVKGNIFESNAEVIVHQVNCQGVMGSGVAKQVKERYPEAFEAYKKLCNVTSSKGLLGSIQSVNVNDNLTIINLFGQDRYGHDGKQYTNYDAFKTGLEVVAKNYKDKKIALPFKIASDRGGANWNDIYKIIMDVFDGCDVTLYEL